MNIQAQNQNIPGVLLILSMKGKKNPNRFTTPLRSPPASLLPSRLDFIWEKLAWSHSPEPPHLAKPVGTARLPVKDSCSAGAPGKGADSVVCHGEVRERRDPEGFWVGGERTSSKTNEAESMPGGEPKVEKDSVRFSTADPTSARSLSCLGCQRSNQSRTTPFDVHPGFKEIFCGRELDGFFCTFSCFSWLWVCVWMGRVETISQQG